jgi:hypothetical protein
MKKRRSALKLLFRILEFLEDLGTEGNITLK